MNFIINLYRIETTWFFDDKDRNITAEPFVCGASEMISKYLKRKGKSDEKSNILVEFSTEPIENADITLTCIEKHRPMLMSVLKAKFGSLVYNHLDNIEWEEDLNAEPTSADYIDQEGDECWLCPAQLKFFGKVADNIYAKFI